MGPLIAFELYHVPSKQVEKRSIASISMSIGWEKGSLKEGGCSKSFLAYVQC